MTMADGPMGPVAPVEPWVPWVPCVPCVPAAASDSQLVASELGAGAVVPATLRRLRPALFPRAAAAADGGAEFPAPLPLRPPAPPAPRAPPWPPAPGPPRGARRA